MYSVPRSFLSALAELGLFGARKKPSRLLSIIDAALDNNPYQRPAMGTPPTIAVSATSDGTLTPFSLANGSALSDFAKKQVNLYGGVPAIVANAYVSLPVASIAPQTPGNLGGSSSLNQWATAIEFMTDADKVQLIAYTSSAVKHMFQVDGQYVDFAGTAGLNATNADCCFLLTFATRKPRRIRMLLPSLPSKGPSFMKAIRITPTCTIWKPPSSQVLRAGWLGDSYSEGANSAGSIYPIPNAAWPVLTCELLGLRDCRQLAVGQTGYISNAAGARLKLRDQLPFYWNQGPFDLLVVAHGYNDASNDPAAITAEALLAYRDIRAANPGVPIVVLGCQAGAGGPSAQQIATDGAIGAAVAQFDDPLCVFHPVSTDSATWLNGTGSIGATNGSGNADVYVDQDKAHPSLAGAEFLAFRSAKAIRQAVATMCA